MTVKLFESGNTLVRLYLHVSYAFAMTLVVLAVRELLPVFVSHAPMPDFFRPDLLLTALLATAILSLMLYLHLPKMIRRCFTIGRDFGL